MRHQKKGRKFGRIKKSRKALMRSLSQALIAHERIETTEARAKELRMVVEKMVTHARRGTLAVRRNLIARIGERAAKKLFEDVAPRYKERPGGYTRVIKLTPRKGDAARRAVIEFVEEK